MANVPTWVIVLFVVLLYLGIKRCFTRVISVNRLAIVPIIFIFMSLRGALTLFSHDSLVWVYLLAGIFIGVTIGYLQVCKRIIRADKTQHLIEIPGDISMLIMLMIIFAIEYFVHYSIDAHLAIANSPVFRIAAMGLSGVMVGISAGRNATYFYKYTQVDSVKLDKK